MSFYKVLSLSVGLVTLSDIQRGLHHHGFSSVTHLSGGSTASVFRAQRTTEHGPETVVIKGALTSNTSSNGHPHIVGEFNYLSRTSAELKTCMAQVLSSSLQALPLSGAGPVFEYFVMEDCGDSLSALMKDPTHPLSPDDFERAISSFMHTFVQDGLLASPPQHLSGDERTERWNTYYMDRLNIRLQTILKHHPELTQTLLAPQFVIHHKGETKSVPNMLYYIIQQPDTFKTLFEPHALYKATHRELNTGNIAYKHGQFKAFDPHSGSDVQESYDFGKLLFGFTFCDIIAGNLKATAAPDGTFELHYLDTPICDEAIKSRYETLLYTAPELKPLRELEPHFIERMYFIQSFQLLCDMGYRIGDPTALVTRCIVASRLFAESPIFNDTAIRLKMATSPHSVSDSRTLETKAVERA